MANYEIVKKIAVIGGKPDGVTKALRWHRFQADIEAVFLRPVESNLKWQ